MNQGNRSMALVIAVMLIAIAFTALPVMAQQITGVPGSPSATTAIRRSRGCCGRSLDGSRGHALDHLL